MIGFQTKPSDSLNSKVNLRVSNPHMVPPGPKKASGGNGETEIFLDVPGEFLGMLKREKEWRGKWEWPKFVHFCDYVIK